MSKLVECPNCLGTGEALVYGKYMKQCKFCKGHGVVDMVTAKGLINEHLLDNE